MRLNIFQISGPIFTQRIHHKTQEEWCKTTKLSFHPGEQQHCAPMALAIPICLDGLPRSSSFNPSPWHLLFVHPLLQ